MPQLTRKIRLKVKPLNKGDEIVMAEDDDDVKKGGNIKARRDDSIIWRHKGGTTKAFVVRFFDFDTNQQIWPFKGVTPASKELLVPDPTSPGDVSKIFNADVPIKYEVSVQGDPNIEPLDPMIIIRGRNLSAMLALAVTSALVGAFLAWLVLSNTVAG